MAGFFVHCYLITDFKTRAYTHLILTTPYPYRGKQNPVQEGKFP